MATGCSQGIAWLFLWVLRQIYKGENNFFSLQFLEKQRKKDFIECSENITDFLKMLSIGELIFIGDEDAVEREGRREKGDQSMLALKAEEAPSQEMWATSSS